MIQRTLGKSGLRTSLLGLGCNNFGWTIDATRAQEVVHKALDLGITTFDEANVYGGAQGNSEEILGGILGSRRKDVTLITKFGYDESTPGNRNTSRRHIIQAAEISLKRLRTDWIDVYMLHWPDAQTPMDETLHALNDLVHSGKVRYIACSNLSAWQVVNARWISRQAGLSAFVAAESEYSVLVRGVEAELIPALQAEGMGLLPYFPLASGLLTGKFKRGEPLAETRLASNALKLGDRYLTDANFDKVETLTAFAKERGHSLLDLAFAWLAARPVVSSVIAGATSPAQLDANAKAISWDLTAAEVAQIDALTA